MVLIFTIICAFEFRLETRSASQIDNNTWPKQENVALPWSCAYG